MTTTTTQAATETITQIALDELHESPFNPRKTFADVDELATNILAEGRIHQPLLVRPRITNPLRDDLHDGFEIVFGHRRYRAAERAGLQTVPCMVRAMSSAEARRAQIAENLARTDVHPIEEAEGFAAMLEHDGVTADDLAVIVGKSRSYIYGRLKLLQACPEVRQACLDGKIGSEVALLVARLRTVKLQEKALAAIRNDTSSSAKMEDGGARSYRHIRDLLAEKFTLSLKDAIFPTEDATLLPDAGPCGTCPKRTGNAPEFDDLAARQREGEHRHFTVTGGPNVCTDPECFAAKKAAHLVREAAALQAKGTVVVTGNKARQSLGARGEVKGAYVEVDKIKATLKKLPKTAPAPTVVEIQDQRTGKLVKAVARADLVAAGAMKAEDAKAVDTDAQRREAHAREAAKAKAKMDAANLRHKALLVHVRQVAAQRPRDEFDLRLIASAALAGVQWADRALVAELHGVKDLDTLKAGIDTMALPQLTALLMDCVLVDDVLQQYGFNANMKPRPLLALAEHYGVDAQAVMAAAEQAAKPASTPSPAGASAKKAKTPPPAPARGVKYRDPMTLQTWSGRGLRPAWINAAIAGGKSLSDFEVKPEVKKVKVDAGVAGERCQHTGDLLEAAGV